MNQSKDETETFVVVSVSGGVHTVSPVTVEPQTVLTRWSLRQVIGPEGKRTRHLVGWADYEGRVCSPIVKFDLDRLRVTTESGRQYHLDGSPGHDPDAEYVFRRWLNFSGLTRQKDLTRSLLRLRGMRGFASPT